MNHISRLLVGIYRFSRLEFWILVGANLLVGLLLALVDLHPFLQAALVLGLGLKSYMYSHVHSILPSKSSEIEQFSWKYYQALPLPKSSLLVFLTLAGLLHQVPFLAWMLAFHQTILREVFEFQNLTLLWSVKFFACLVPTLVWCMLFGIKQGIELPRQQHIKGNRFVFYVQVKNFLVYSVCVIYALVCFFLGWALLERLTPMVLAGLRSLAPYVLNGFGLAAGIAVSCAYVYDQTLKVWLNERLSYARIDWKPKRDSAIIFAMLALLYLPVPIFHSDVPGMYQGTALNEAVFRRERATVEQLLAEGHVVDRANKHGFSPIMVAAHKGNLELFKLLEKKGAKKDGRITAPGSVHTGMNLYQLAVDGMNVELVKHLLSVSEKLDLTNPELGTTALHVAAHNCDSPMIDFLIETGVEVNGADTQGQTPLHVAAARNCFSSIISLLEAGGDLHVRDKTGKLAVDHVKAWSKDLDYLLTKKTRAPASR